jgi:hypothetical protein
VVTKTMQQNAALTWLNWGPRHHGTRSHVNLLLLPPVLLVNSHYYILQHVNSSVCPDTCIMQPQVDDYDGAEQPRYQAEPARLHRMHAPSLVQTWAGVGCCCNTVLYLQLMISSMMLPTKSC